MDSDLALWKVKRNAGDAFGKRTSPVSICLNLLVAVAAAHAFICGLTAAAIGTGFDLDGLQGAILLVSAMIHAAGYTATDVGVGLFLIHDYTLLTI